MYGALFLCLHSLWILLHLCCHLCESNLLLCKDRCKARPVKSCAAALRLHYVANYYTFHPLSLSHKLITQRHDTKSDEEKGRLHIIWMQMN